MKTFYFDDFVCKLGESAKENWSLLDNSKPHHLFFHLSSFPSGYVIVEYENTEPTHFILHTAAQICKNGTKFKYLNDVKVDWCRCDNLKKSDKIGEVFFNSNRRVQQIKV